MAAGRRQRRWQRREHIELVWLAVLAAVAAIPGAFAQVDDGGTRLCACSPPTYEFAVDLNLVCPPTGVQQNDAISAVSCIISPASAGDLEDRVPVRLESVTILDLGQDLRVLSTVVVPGNFTTGDTFDFTSIVSESTIPTAVDVPKAIQIFAEAFNAADQALINILTITFTNNCTATNSVLEVGQTAGFFRFTQLGTPNEEFCPPVTDAPSMMPITPTGSPTAAPLAPPTENPTPAPTDPPTENPTPLPTPLPTPAPTENPTPLPTPAPTDAPTMMPTDPPTVTPTDPPTVAPTNLPTVPPTNLPTVAPTDPLTAPPTVMNTTAPTGMPTISPTIMPTISVNVTVSPTVMNTTAPTGAPAIMPIATNAPNTDSPVGETTKRPSEAPVMGPTIITRPPGTTPPEDTMEPTGGSMSMSMSMDMDVLPNVAFATMSMSLSMSMSMSLSMSMSVTYWDEDMASSRLLNELEDMDKTVGRTIERTSFRGRRRRRNLISIGAGQ